MYLRHAIRKKDGKLHRYWCLVRSVRVGRRVIQQVVAHLGELDEQGRLQARALARRLIAGTVLPAIERVAHRRGLVPPHSACRSVAAWRGSDR